MNFPAPSVPLLLAAGLAVLAYGCAPAPVTPPVDPPPPDEEVERLSPRESMSRAEVAAERGQRREAARWFENAADVTDDPGLRQEALLRAAEQWLRVDELEAAATALRRIDLGHLIGDEPIRYRLARAEILFRQGNPAAARIQLTLLPTPPSGWEAEYFELRARIAEQLGQHLAVVRLRSTLEEYLERPSARDRNRQLLWASLARIPIQPLEQLVDEEEVVQGWIDLALLTRAHRLNPHRLGEAMTEWSETYPDHPALDRQVPQILARFQEQFRPPQRIAVMLPLSGDLRDAARAVRDGVLAAYYAAPGERPEITIYDTGGDRQRLLEMVEEAVAAGAEQIIGPLTKGELAALADAGEVAIPVLALNTLDDEMATPSGSLFQFALDPEAEAIAAARHAHALGWRNAVALVPDNAWGERISNAFRQGFEEAPDAEVLQIASYDPGARDFAGPIRSALNLDASDRRYRQLSGTIGQRPHFTPQRRQDVDGIFLAAFPEQARLLRPQIEYHHAQDLPVLATSHVYTGRHDPDRDRDLDGLYFLDGPWMVDAAAAVGEALERAALREVWGDQMDRFARLTALGIDAYRILPYLDILQEYPDEAVEGLTGQLRIREDGHIERTLVPAQFRGGRAFFQPLPPPLPATFEEDFPEPPGLESPLRSNGAEEEPRP